MLPPVTVDRPRRALAGATPYLKLAGDVIGGWMLARQAQAVAGGDDAWSKSKPALARVFASQVLAQAPGLAAGVMEGADDFEAVGAEALGA